MFDVEEKRKCPFFDKQINYNAIYSRQWSIEIHKLNEPIQ